MDANQISESCQSLIQGTRYLVYRHQYLFGRDMSRLADRPLRLSHCSGDQLWLGSKCPTHNLEVRGIIIVQENNNFTYKMTISQDGRSRGSQNRIMRDALGTAHRTYKRSVVKLIILADPQKNRIVPPSILAGGMYRFVTRGLNQIHDVTLYCHRCMYIFHLLPLSTF